MKRLLLAWLISPWFALVHAALLPALLEASHVGEMLSALCLMVVLGGVVCLPIVALIGIPTYLLLQRFIPPGIFRFVFIGLGSVSGFIIFQYINIKFELDQTRPFSEMNLMDRSLFFGATPGFVVSTIFSMIAQPFASPDNNLSEQK